MSLTKVDTTGSKKVVLSIFMNAQDIKMLGRDLLNIIIDILSTKVIIQGMNNYVFFYSFGISPSAQRNDER